MSSLSLSTDFRNLGDINLNDIEYSADAQTGVILINWGAILEGKLMVLLAGNRAQQNELEVELRNRL